MIFMKIKKLPKSMMPAVVDKVINVPMELQDVEKTIHSLPRPPDEAEIIAVKLKLIVNIFSCKEISICLKLRLFHLVCSPLHFSHSNNDRYFYVQFFDA